MKALVVGYGSIGRRHARILEELGCSVGVVSQRDVGHPRVFNGLIPALEKWNPDYLVIANKTSEHFDTVASLANYGFQGKVLSEKPLFDRFLEIPANSFSSFGVAYNLRFHPLIQRLQDFLRDQNPLSALVYVGQYLPQWRPGSDYRDSYSSKNSQGGGVLRDLSHELDYTNWLLGGWKRLTANGGHFSHLELHSDDFFDLLIEMNNCPLVGIHLNYLDRIPRREILIHTDENSFRLDLVNGTIALDEKIEKHNLYGDLTYLKEHQAILSDDISKLCSPQEGLAIVKMIECAEKASREKVWVDLK